MYTAFDGRVTTYNTAKDAYNTELKKEKDRLADFAKSLFDAPISIPQRPCPPD
jgi:hypothetical protein